MILIDEPLMYAFVAFWIIWVAVRRKEPGRWLIKFCEGPLVTFARFIDFYVMRMAGFFVWVSKNPMVALRIKEKEVRLKVEKPVITPKKAEEYERGLEEVRIRYTKELPRLSLGASILLILLFFLVYLAMYLLTVH
ncbi:hypothetical protein CW713_11165 [Methanophagales archaeon]|nr:MAG: hypothetical protein CW713_11165 [Methanophagales archaeon]